MAFGFLKRLFGKKKKKARAIVAAQQVQKINPLEKKDVMKGLVK